MFQSVRSVFSLSVSHTGHINQSVGILSHGATAEHLPVRKSSAYENLTWNLRRKIVYTWSSSQTFLANESEKQDRQAILDSNCKCTHITANLVTNGEIKYLHLKRWSSLSPCFVIKLSNVAKFAVLTRSRGEDKSFGSCYDPFNWGKSVPALLWQEAGLQFKLLDTDPQGTVATFTTKELTSKLSHVSVFQNFRVCKTAPLPHCPRKGNQNRMS